ncbi:MAG: SNF2-related protein [bacterium]
MFIVNCIRDGRKDRFILKFKYDPEMINKIKEIPSSDREFDPDNKVWILKTYALYLLMQKFKNKKDYIFFNFFDKEKEYFKKRILKKQKEIQEKERKFKELEEKKEYWLKYKEQLKETYKVHEDKLHQKLKDGVKLYPYQSQAALFCNAVRNVLLALDMGTGKAQPVDSKLLTPNGWVRMGDLNIGDFVFGSDGKPKRILGIYDQGVKDIYKVDFNDKTSVECCNEHLWNVNTPSRNKRGHPYLTISVDDILNNGYKMKNGDSKYYIPVVNPIEFEKKDYIIHPYNMGCLLGDGCLSIDYVVSINNPEQELIDIFKNNLDCDHYLRKSKLEDTYYVQSNLEYNNKYSREILRLGLRGKKSHDKFIPKEYLFGSVEDRLELLQGLMDTDGYAGKTMNEITLKSKQLIDDLRFLVESLGGIGRLNDKFVNYNGEKVKFYRLLVKLPLNMSPFKIKRKKDSYYPPIKYKPNRGIKNIEYVGKKEARCITVDSDDGLYVTNNCILTHNTIVSISFSEYNNFNKIFVITPNSLKFNYHDEVEKFTNSKSHIIGWKKNKYSLEEAKYIIVNYDFFRSKKSIDKFKKLGIDKIDCLILDECHKLSNTQTNTHKNITEIFTEKIFNNNEECKIFMSGTPMTNRVYQLYTILNQISPLEFSNKNDFYENYCGLVYDPDEYSNYRFESDKVNYGLLFDKISPYVFRLRKEEVLSDLPSKTYQKILFTLTNKELSEYNNVKTEIIEQLEEDEVLNPLLVILRLRQFLSMKKVNNVDFLNFIETILENNEKIVIMDVFTESLTVLKEKYGDRAVLHYGKTEISERREMIRKFQDPNSGVDIFLSTTQTGKEGLTLTAASKIVELTQPYSYGENEQIIDRVHRIGQKEKVNAYYPVFDNTIDIKIFNDVEGKKYEIKKVLDGIDYESNIPDLRVDDLIKSIKEEE